MDIQKKELKNGLVVVSEAMPQFRSVSIGFWVRSGSRFEDAEVSGISHFIEHLLFKGTGTRTAEEIARTIDSVGGQLDAFTDKEYVGFYARVLDRHLPLAFELLSDIILNPVFPPRELERERNVIFEELSTVEDSPQDLIQDLYLENFWDGHPLGRRVAGTKETVARIARRQVVEYFRRNYNAACNTVVAVAGNVRHRQVQELAGRYLAGMPAGTAAETGSPPTPRAARAIHGKPNLEQVHLCIGVPCPERTSDDRFCLHLLNTILGGGISSRLFQNVREKLGLVYAIDSNLNVYRDAGTLVVSAATAPGTAARVARLILKEFRKLRDDLVSEAELQRAKECVQGSLALSLEGPAGRMMYLAQQQIDFGTIQALAKVMNRIERVSRSDIRRLAGSMFDRAFMTMAALGSDGRPLENVRLSI